MEHELLIGLGSVLALGISAQWLAWRLHLPSILLLLLAGFLAGPITGFLNPDLLLGDLLFPIVSLSVGVILFEGGMSLNIRALQENGSVITNMIVIGGLVTWMLATLAAWLFLGFDPGLSLLLGAILIVTGPTVIVPLLLFIRPIGRVGPITKWEGIVNDPIGAIVAVLVFQALVSGGGAAMAALGLLTSLIIGLLVGIFGAFIIVVMLKRFWLPDLLQEPVALMTAIGIFIFANSMQTEAGLLAVTVMGIVLANQKWVSVKHIIEFKERLRVLLISTLFVLLAARMQLSDLAQIGWGSVAFLGALILVVRPLAIYFSTLRSDLKKSEKAFLAWMAPRGIVAAAVASVFALKLASVGYPGAERLMPEVFFVIIGTVFVYGLTAGPFARKTKLSEPSPQGLLIVGAHPLARAIGRAVKDEDFEVMLVDTNRPNVVIAKMEGLTAYNENIVYSPAMDSLALHSIGSLIALTPNDEANSLAALHFAEVLGRSQVFQLPPKTIANRNSISDSPSHLRGRFLFTKAASFETLSGRFNQGAQIKTILLTQKFTMESFVDLYGESGIPLFLITQNHELTPFTVDAALLPESGHKIIALVDPLSE